LGWIQCYIQHVHLFQFNKSSKRKTSPPKRKTSKYNIELSDKNEESKVKEHRGKQDDLVTMMRIPRATKKMRKRTVMMMSKRTTKTSRLNNQMT
jgi:hypothetical protein